jgi:hypothetical protein
MVPMIQLLYVSVASEPFDDVALRALLALARKHNERVGVTGALMHQQGSFLQVLEGPAEIVDPLYVKIGRDRRHHRVIMLSRKSITEGNFPDWSMGFVDVKGTAAVLPGFRRIGDLAGLSGDTATVERVIAAFRDGRWRAAA